MLNVCRNWLQNARKALSLTITLASLFLLSPRAFADNLSAGPLYDKFPLTIGEGQRTEIMGPFYYREQNGDVRSWGLPPFFSSESDPTIEECEDYSLYPIFSYVKYGTQYRAQFCQLLSFAGGEDPDHLAPRRFWLFPIYFQQRCADSNEDYTAVFPFYGHLRNVLFRDRIYFVMFPAYSRTQKKDVVNDNYFYPFYNVRHGTGMQGWQFWPFYGAERKVVTLATNQWGMLETNGGHVHTFILWPFDIRQDNGIGTDDPEKIRAYIPFYCEQRSPQRDWTAVLWPFFNWADDREKKYKEWDMPWPLIVVARGEGKTATRVFPFFGKARNSSLEDNFYFWPIYKYNAIHAPPLERRRTRIAFFLYQNTSDRSTETGQVRRRVDLWPFFVYRHDLDGDTRLQALALLETFFPDSPGIERTWSPLWSVWRSERNAATGDNSQSCLWNLYRRDVSSGRKKISCFFGLYQYQRDANEKSLRLFYFPVMKRTAPPSGQ